MAAADTGTVYINEDGLVRWDRARKASDGTFINSGSGGWELKDADETSLGTGAMTYVTGSSGRWHGTIDKTVVDDLTPGAKYWLEVTLTDGAGADGFRRIELVAKYHGTED